MLAVITVQFATFAEYGQQWFACTSPDARGFYLAYTDLERTLSLIRPLASVLLSERKGLFLTANPFDRKLMLEKRSCLVTLERGPMIPTIDAAAGVFMSSPTGETFFVPKQPIEGEDRVCATIANRIAREMWGAENPRY